MVDNFNYPHNHDKTLRDKFLHIHLNARNLQMYICRKFHNQYTQNRVQDNLYRWNQYHHRLVVNTHPHIDDLPASIYQLCKQYKWSRRYRRSILQGILYRSCQSHHHRMDLGRSLHISHPPKGSSFLHMMYKHLKLYTQHIPHYNSHKFHWYHHNKT